MKKIAQGAEAIIYADTESGAVLKDRFSKSYRHPDLDRRLRRSRTRREAKILEKMRDAGVSVPGLMDVDDSQMLVRMELIPGRTVKEVIDDLESSGSDSDIDKYLAICREIGSKVALMHDNRIVHHDLTTSNMILHKEQDEVFLIDFGLSFFSDKVEDYAVDLHLLKHALESRHHRIFDRCFEEVLSGYRSSSGNADEILKRLEKVELRGRNKLKH